MYSKLIFLLSFFLIIQIIIAYDQSDVVSAKIETCRGCSLNRLPEVKKFVMEDAPFYENVEVKFISGAPPELVLLGGNDQELDRLPLSNLDRQECNQLIQEFGFSKKSNKEDL